MFNFVKCFIIRFEIIWVIILKNFNLISVFSFINQSKLKILIKRDMTKNTRMK